MPRGRSLRTFAQTVRPIKANEHDNGKPIEQTTINLRQQEDDSSTGSAGGLSVGQMVTIQI